MFRQMQHEHSDTILMPTTTRIEQCRSRLRPAMLLAALTAMSAPVVQGYTRDGVHVSARALADTISVRLLTDVNSGSDMRGKPVRAIVIAPLMLDSHVIIAPRSILEGTIVDAGKENDGGERHFVRLQFTSLTLIDGTREKFDARVVSVDNARETVTDDGRILGPAKASLAKSKEDWAAAALGSVVPIGGVILFAATRGESDERNRRINYPAGTDMVVKVSSNLDVLKLPQPPKIDSVASNVALAELLTRVPLRAVAAGGRIPGDFVNVIVLGSEAQVKSAFTAAGWDSPNKMGTRADFDTFIKTAKGQGYSHEPVSQQLMFGRAPDLVFQRVSDTFAKRHHVRIWNTGQTFEGIPVWVAPATHDIGVEFSTAHRSFTHRTDNNIDGERNKIVNDLSAFNVVGQLSYVTRAPEPDAAARLDVVSDWKVVVVKLVP